MSKKLLLVSPAFHGYWKSIASAWERLGYDVTVHCYDAYATTKDKARNKLFFELPEKLGVDESVARAELATQRSCDAFDAVQPDYTFVIKGDTLRESFWERVRRGPSILWLYDELRRTKWTLERLKDVGPIASYSHDDTQEMREGEFDAHYLPLAFDETRPFTKRVADELVFVGARYPKREETLTNLVEHGVKVRAYGRDWSRHAADRLRTWSLSRPEIPSGRDLSLEDAWGAMAGANSALNVHGDQDGFTMRTFEACGVGGVQLVDRAEAAEFYEIGTELLAYSTMEELVDHASRAASDRAWADGIREAGKRRTLAEHTFRHRMELANEWWG